MPLHLISKDTKAIVASNLVVAQELRRLVRATEKGAIASDYSNDMFALMEKIMKLLDQ